MIERYNDYVNLSRVLDLMFPKRCIGCRHLGSYFCESCTRTIQVITSGEGVCPMCQRRALDGQTHRSCLARYSLDGLTCFFRYRGVVQKGIKAIKYRFVFDSAQAFAELVPLQLLTSQNIVGKGRGKDIVLVPIPLHKSRMRERGFNQAEMLGIHIARRFGILMTTDVLVRKKPTLPQVTMKDRDKRLKNMANVFSVMKVPPRYVILFDDVFTTGATMRSAAEALKRAGAKFVWAVTMAR